MVRRSGPRGNDEIETCADNLTLFLFTSRLSTIVPVNVVLNRTVAVDSIRCFDNLFGSHLCRIEVN